MNFLALAKSKKQLFPYVYWKRAILTPNEYLNFEILLYLFIITPNFHSDQLDIIGLNIHLSQKSLSNRQLPNSNLNVLGFFKTKVLDKSRSFFW